MMERMTNKRQEVPILRGEELYVPFVGAIIERESEAQTKQILIQIREKESDPLYSGSIEIPGGKMQAFEDIYETLSREVREESGLEIIFVKGKDKRADYKNREDVSSLIEPFCVTQMQNGPFIGLIFLCKAMGEPALKTSESKNAKWVDIDDLREIVYHTPEKIYTAFLAPLKKYLKESENDPSR